MPFCFFGRRWPASFLQCAEKSGRMPGIMSHDTAFFGASTIFGKYWTKHRYFDYLIDKENFRLSFGKSFRMMVYLDNAVANGPAAVRQDVEADTKATNYLINHLSDIKPELTVFVTTADMLPHDADENTPAIQSSDDPYVQNRINMYQAVNRQFGRVLNVHLTEIANPRPEFNPLLHTLLHPDTVKKGKLPFAPLERHQLYLPQRIMGDVERCIPLGIPSIIPAMPELTTMELVELFAPQLLDKLPAPSPDDPIGSCRKSIHSFQWLDPKDGYLLTREDQIELLKFYFLPELL